MTQMRTAPRRRGWIRLAGFTLLIIREDQSAVRAAQALVIAASISAILAISALALSQL